MHRNRVALAMLVTVGLAATGCGSDDTEPDSDTRPAAAARAEKAKPKRESARAQTVKCIESELGYEVTSDDDSDKLSIKTTQGDLDAVVVVHPNAGAARKAVDKTLEGGLNAVVFGRAEFIRHGADDTEAGGIANCVAIAYNRPRR
jgi:hypothetical protein